MSLHTTPVSSIPQIVDGARRAFASGKTLDYEFRMQQLNALYRMMTEPQTVDSFSKAMAADLRKNKHESLLTEVQFIANEVVEAMESLSQWMKPKFVETPLINRFDKCHKYPEPYGTALIIGAWNYPVQVLLGPLVGAIAAGCTAVLKPSELAVNTANLITELMDRYLDKDCYRIVNGGVEETTALLEQRFDKIVYTGNSAVAKIIMAAAAKHLTPVTLELGGKSPTIVDRGVDLNIVARRIAWGRFMNCGQTCIAPDYVLCPADLQQELVANLAKALREYYGTDPQSSPDYARIVNRRHFERVSKLLSSGKVEIGGKTDLNDLYIAPTVMTNVSPDSPVMQEEIFGPVLPILNCESIDDAIDFINAREKPLAMYIFSNDQAKVQRMLKMTSAGGVAVNDCLMHAAVSTLPFGGVGNSGMGAYHGHHSFDDFTHYKAVMIKPLALESLNGLRYPPYTEKKISWVAKVLFKKPSTFLSRNFKYLALAGLLATVAGAVQLYAL